MIESSFTGIGTRVEQTPVQKLWYGAVVRVSSGTRIVMGRLITECAHGDYPPNHVLVFFEDAPNEPAVIPFDQLVTIEMPYWKGV